jgi:nitrogen regulatory protein P-II 1
MKKIEVVITPSTMDTFKEIAPRLGIKELDLIGVHRSARTANGSEKRLYRGSPYIVDLLPRVKLEFVLSDDDMETTLHQLLELVHPESIAVVTVDALLRPSMGCLRQSSAVCPTARPSSDSIVPIRPSDLSH